MYAYAAIQVERANVLTLPASAVATRGNVNEGYQEFCFLVRERQGLAHARRGGLARRSDGVQVLKKHVHGAWHDFNGDEQVVQGELASLADGQEVTVAAKLEEPIQISHAPPSAVRAK